MNRINLTGRLTADPELRELPNGTKVCQLRLAVEGMGRGNDVGYIDVASYGPSGEAAASVLRKGWLVAVDGRIEWRSWETDDVKRQAHSLVGNIEFLASPKGEAGEHAPPVGTPVAAGTVSTGGDDDIPF